MTGYDPEFLGSKHRIGIPWIDYDVFADVLKKPELRNNYIADYLHYSVVMSKKNRQAYLSICNLNQEQIRKVSGRRWFIDTRIGEKNQLDNIYYSDKNGEKNLWDRGHLTRRTAVTWGDDDFTARKASNGSCSYANACLQHKYFNEDEWRIPERIADKFGRDLDGKISIMTGPVFSENDRWYEPPGSNVAPARIPAGFWKVLYYIDKKKTEAQGKKVLGCEAYLVWQNELALRGHGGAHDLEISTLQVTVTELSDLTGIEFPAPLYDANPLWYYRKDDRDIKEPERFEIKVRNKSKNVREGWEGHVIHDRADIEKHGFQRVSA